MNWEDVAREINECKYLYLRWIGEPLELRLKLIIEEAGTFGTPALAPLGQHELESIYESAVSIESNESCRLFEIEYDQPISYTVLNETYGCYPEEPERFEGNLFRIFSWSYLLEMTKKTTYASDDHPGPGPLQHHEIACLNHVIDIITTMPPVMRIVRPKPSVRIH